MTDRKNDQKIDVRFEELELKITGTGRNKETAAKETVQLFLPLLAVFVLLTVIRISDRNREPVPAVTAAVKETEPEEKVIKVSQPSAKERHAEELSRKARAFFSEYQNPGVILSDGSVNFRSSPDSDDGGNKIGQLHDLDVCERLETEGDWYLVEHDGKTGYVSSAYCQDGDEAALAALILLGSEKSGEFMDPVVIRTEGNSLRIFSEPVPNDMSLLIGQISSGCAFDLLEELDEWLKIRSGKIEGYIPKERYALGEKAVQIAEIKAGEYCDVKASLIFVRNDPHYARSNIIGSLNAGDRITVEEKEPEGAQGAGWIRFSGSIHTESGTQAAQGYINTGGNNAAVVFGLDTAVPADARKLVLETYQNPVVCITSGYVNIRKSTNTDSYKNIIGKIYPGNGAELLNVVSPEESEDGHKWLKIRSGDVSGFVSAGTGGEEWFAAGEKASEAAYSYAKLTARITADVLNVRSSPTNETNENVWTQVTRGQAYEVLDQNGDWVKIDLGSEDGENEAYISKNESFIRISYGLEEAIEFSYQEKASAFRQSIIDYACQFIGNPYVWGGNSLTKGCDCSGFVQQIMKKYGISMERSSYYQAKQGIRRTSADMRVGDLIFYAGKDGVVNHVGIYIGGGYMVGAQSKRSGIKVVKWNYRTPVAIRDVIGDRIE